MKYYGLALMILVCISPDVLSQGRYGIALEDTSLVCISSLEGVLYSGIDNYVRVDSSLYADCDEIYLETTQGIAMKDTNNLFLVIPERPGKVRVSLLCKNESGEEEVARYQLFHVRNLPEPQLTLDTIPISNPSYIAKNVLIRCDSLGVYFSDDLVGSSEWLSITEFQLGYTYGGFHVTHKNETNKISEETKSILNQLGPDHEISIRTTVRAMGNVRKQLPIYRIRIY